MTDKEVFCIEHVEIVLTALQDFLSSVISTHQYNVILAFSTIFSAVCSDALIMV